MSKKKREDLEEMLERGRRVAGGAPADDRASRGTSTRKKRARHLARPRLIDSLSGVGLALGVDLERRAPRRRRTVPVRIGGAFLADCGEHARQRVLVVDE